MSDELEIRLSYAPSFRRYAGGGIWGSVTGNGMVAADFYLDIQPLPETVRIDPVTGIEVSRVAAPHDVRRELQAGVVLTAEEAMSIGHWFMQTAGQVIAARASALTELQSSEVPAERNEDGHADTAA